MIPQVSLCPLQRSELGLTVKHAGWYCVASSRVSPLFLNRVANSKDSPNRASSRAAEAPPTSVYMTMAVPSGMASSGTRTSSQQSTIGGQVFIVSVSSRDRLDVPVQTGRLPLHEPAEGQSSNLEPFREKPSWHAKRHSEPKLKFPRGCEHVMDRREDKARMGSHRTAGTF